MTKDELERAFELAEGSSSASDHIAFKARLLELGGHEGAAFHYELIFRSRNAPLVDTLCRFFKWRGPPGEAFLAERVPLETDPMRLATALQILGTTRSEHALLHARRLCRHTDELVRERACLVLGWVGEPTDLETLAVLQSDAVSKIRRWAATQQTHILGRYEACEREVLENLRAALAHEAESEVQGAIAHSVQTILKKRFGLKLNRDTKQVEGDVDKAMQKARRAIAKRLDG